MAAVVAASFFLLIMGLTLASLSVADLSFASSFQRGLSDEFLARAAIQQFLSDDRRLRRRGFYPPPARPPSVDWETHFRTNPVFPDGGKRLNGEVAITFDRSKPYFSRDNTFGGAPVAGWVDQGGTTLSVPPQCVSLVIETRSAGRVSHFEAILQCRWPYAITSSAPVRMGGSPPPPDTMLRSSSNVTGSILLLDKPLREEVPPPAEPALYREAPIRIFDQMYDTLAKTAVTADDAPVRLGFTFPMGDLGGNVLNGRVDSKDGLAPVINEANPPNQWNGRARSGFSSLRQRQLIGQVFVFPPAPTYSDLADDAYKIDETTGQIVITKDVTFGDPDPNRGFSSYGIDGSLSNFYEADLPAPDPANPNVRLPAPPKPTLRLQNCSLFVNGDLDIALGGLKGDNSTLIVNGNVVVRDGSLDAADNGMVILCKSFCASATGVYRGLLLVRDCAVFCEPVIEDPETGGYIPLDIRGAVVCGGGEVSLERMPPPGITPPPTPPLKLQGFNLCSAKFTWDPRYLNSLTGISDYELIRFRRLD